MKRSAHSKAQIEIQYFTSHSETTFSNEVNEQLYNTECFVGIRNPRRRHCCVVYTNYYYIIHQISKQKTTSTSTPAAQTSSRRLYTL